jgi:hypothetical protein
MQFEVSISDSLARLHMRRRFVECGNLLPLFFVTHMG